MMKNNFFCGASPLSQIPTPGEINRYVNRQISFSLLGSLGLSAIITLLVQNQINKNFASYTPYLENMFRDFNSFKK